MHGIIMNYHITNVIYVITSNSLGQMQTRMEFFLLFKDYFIRKLLTKVNQMILPSNDIIFSTKLGFGNLNNSTLRP